MGTEELQKGDGLDKHAEEVEGVGDSEVVAAASCSLRYEINLFFLHSYFHNFLILTFYKS